MTLVRDNPFTPGFGVMPLFMVGRDQLLSDMRRALDRGVGDPNLTSIFIGARGTGKTAMLSCIEFEAQQLGWVTVDVFAAKGMMNDILVQAMAASQEFVSQPAHKHLTGIDIGNVIGVHWAVDEAPETNWRLKMSALLDELGKADVGLLITVDEVKASVDEMISFVSMYQLFVREGYKVALVMAGLPKHVSGLVTNEDVSFLRRARQHYLESINDAQVEIALQRSVEAAEKSISKDALTEAVKAIGGFPYMLQLVGYYSWEASGAEGLIGREHVLRGIELARRDLETGVFDATLRELSEGDRAFLRAMLADETESRLAEVARRMGKTNSYASSYKVRLANQGIIEELPAAGFRFAIPFFREYFEKVCG